MFPTDENDPMSILLNVFEGESGISIQWSRKEIDSVSSAIAKKMNEISGEETFQPDVEMATIELPVPVLQALCTATALAVVHGVREGLEIPFIKDNEATFMDDLQGLYSSSGEASQALAVAFLASGWLANKHFEKDNNEMADSFMAELDALPTYEGGTS